MIVVTHSDIMQFLTCRRQWWWGYVEDRTPPEREVGALALGSRVHVAILEGFYRDGADPVARHDELIRETNERMLEAGAAPWELEALYEDAIVGRNCVTAYMDWLSETGADQGLEVDGVEDQIEVPIMDDRVLLRGKVDLRFRDENGIVLNDLKTSGRAPSVVAPQLERSFQLYVYDWIESMLKPDDLIVEASYTVIKKVTRRQHGHPYVERFHVPGMVRSRPTIRAQLTGVIEEMIRVLSQFGSMDRVAYSTPQEACSWCAFKAPCMVWNESPSAGQAMLDDRYTRGRHARYSDGDETRDEGT